MNKSKKTARTKSDRIKSRLNGESSQTQEEIYEVDAILNKKIKYGMQYYQVSWKNYPRSQATWQPKSNMTNCNSLILQYQLTHLSQQNKIDLAQFFFDQNSFKQQTDPLPLNIYQHNLEAIKENSTINGLDSILGFLKEKIKEESTLINQFGIQEILGSQIQNEGDKLIWFRVRLTNNKLVRVQRKQVIKNNRRKLIEYYQSLIQWS